MSGWTRIITGLLRGIFAACTLSACGEDTEVPANVPTLTPTLEETLAEASANAALYLPGCMDEYWDGRGGSMSRAAAGGDVRAMECLWSRYGRDRDLGVDNGYMLYRATGRMPDGFEERVRRSTHFRVAFAIEVAHQNASFLTEVPFLEDKNCYSFDETPQEVLALADRSVISEMVCSEKSTARWPWPFSLVFG